MCRSTWSSGSIKCGLRSVQSSATFRALFIVVQLSVCSRQTLGKERRHNRIILPHFVVSDFSTNLQIAFQPNNVKCAGMCQKVGQQIHTLCKSAAAIGLIIEILILYLRNKNFPNRNNSFLQRKGSFIQNGSGLQIALLLSF